MSRYHPGYDSRIRRKIGASVDTLPEILRGVRRVQGWLEIAAREGIILPNQPLYDLRAALVKVLPPE